MTKQRKLSAQEANRLAIQLQVLRIKVLEFTLNYSFKGKCYLWGQEVDRHTLTREKVKLSELYRVKTIHETTIRNLPYLPSGGSRVDKIKEHYLADEGTIGFVEVKDSSHGASVINHLWSKRTIKKRIKKKLQKSKKMATKKRVVKPHDEEDLLGFDVDASSLLEGIDETLTVYTAGDKIEFVHAGGKVKGSVIKSGLSEGRVKVADAGGTVYMVKPKDIIPNGGTASEHIGKGKKPIYQETVHKASKAEKQQGMKKPVIREESLKESTTVKKTIKGGTSQKDLVEALAEKGERDYDKIAEKTGVTRTNVGQYMYRWKKANPKKA